MATAQDVIDAWLKVRKYFSRKLRNISPKAEIKRIDREIGYAYSKYLKLLELTQAQCPNNDTPLSQEAEEKFRELLQIIEADETMDSPLVI